ncbi:CxxxxCH/CxxCH domain-containing protein [Thalassolituus sp. TMPB967]|nr:CxxxxCH/CxxCH domain-containing protein [Thalassolituus alkanivorans]MCB2425122.1 CxxxxCH/CxxCH domain-containing protein [Thalassolituus alkanivorans]
MSCGVYCHSLRQPTTIQTRRQQAPLWPSASKVAKNCRCCRN